MGNFDPLRLRPPTVEELAAQERAEVKADKPALRGRHRRDRGRRGLLVTLVTVGLLVTGAGAFALARSGSEPEAAQPYGPDAPFGVSYVDGFGEHSPKPSPSAASSRARPKVSVTVSGSASVPASPTPSTVDSGGGGTLEAAPVTMSAVQWTMAFDGNYEAFVWVKNEGTKAAPWEVRVTLPSGATVTRTMSADRRQTGGAFVFTSPRGDLPPGQVYLFGFSGAAGDGRFSLRSCTVNGVACAPFR